ncbi:DUF748 domain-containing protein [Flavihumibacter petaseus]|uniref:DUF748 domain-containing protein n=1 Tax=Flavihumibacter petaseus NBRC 106054 TaxID=1220578 RepID=A0A0E9N2I0_9BACT|nr:DUF748 domain-containing protein [Flavihumibacter petaseus]GAO43998.1 hypothetical protein FPE01S_03_00370 [Flavihumibacter petaseus NBRC 106054]
MALTKTRKVVYISLGILLIGLVVLRILLPGILLRYVNRQLTRIDGYTGHVEDIDVALFRGAYTIDSIRLDKKSGKIPVPFFSAHEIDISIEWRALFNGKIVAEIEADRPKLNFVKGPTEATSQTDIDKDWTDVVDKLMPFKLNHFQVNNGEVHYRDFHSSPKVDVLAQHIEISARNLSNAKRDKDALPSPVTATADVYDGKVTVNMKMNALAKQPTFDLNTRMTTLSLVKLNDFLKAYGNFDVEKGTISLYTEAAAKDGRISGYTKPVIKDLKVVNWKEDKENPAKLVWESIVEGVAWVLNNKKEDQIATRAKFEGNIKDPDVNAWVIVGQLLRNAFIEALYPSLENSVNINSVGKQDEKKTFLQEIFDKDRKENNAPDDKKKSKKELRKERRKEKREEREKRREERKKENTASKNQ